MSKSIVVKIGGVASGNLTPAFFEKIRLWQKAGKQVVIVHGGGQMISAMLKRMDIPCQTKEGLRVTTPETLAVTKMVLLGEVQPQLMTAFQSAKMAAVGLNAGDDALLTAEPIKDQTLGLVGEVAQVKTAAVKALMSAGFIPVIAPLGITKQQQWLNINADVAACAVAAALQAEQLFLLTDVPGVKIGTDVQPHLTPEQTVAAQLDGTIYGGMIPKLNSAVKALASGVRQVVITNQLHKAGTTIEREVSPT